MSIYVYSVLGKLVKTKLKSDKKVKYVLFVR